MYDKIDDNCMDIMTSIGDTKYWRKVIVLLYGTHKAHIYNKSIDSLYIQHKHAYIIFINNLDRWKNITPKPAGCFLLETFFLEI